MLPVKRNLNEYICNSYNMHNNIILFNHKRCNFICLNFSCEVVSKIHT